LRCRLNWLEGGICEEDGDEPALVRGVRLLLEARDEKLFSEADWLLALKTEDVVLAWELAEPTPLRISPCADSVSSVGMGGCAASDMDRSDLAGPSRGPSEEDIEEDILGSRSVASEDALDFARSRSVAFSLAARGAAGKNWAKPVPDALGGIFFDFRENGGCTVCLCLYFLNPPAFIITHRESKPR